MKLHCSFKALLSVNLEICKKSFTIVMLNCSKTIREMTLNGQMKSVSEFNHSKDGNASE